MTQEKTRLSAIATRMQAVTTVKKLSTSLDMPRGISLLIEKVLMQIPVATAQAFPVAMLTSCREGADLTGVHSRMLLWILQDPVYGMGTVLKNIGSITALDAVASLIDAQLTSADVCTVLASTSQLADAAQANAWARYTTCHDNQATDHVARAEWMAACAVAHSLQPHPACLTGVVETAAIAWVTATKGAPVMSTESYYIGIHDHLLNLFKTAPIPTSTPMLACAKSAKAFSVGDAVVVDDDEIGLTKGTIVQIQRESATPYAEIDIPSRRAGGAWKVPLNEIDHAGVPA